MTANAVLAERARQLAAAAPNGSPARKASLVAAVALAESTSVAGARKILNGWDDAPAAVRRDAIQLLDALTAQEIP
jgi:hypothetical protein